MEFTWILFTSILMSLSNHGRADSCKEAPIDLIFVLDASHSIWIPDFKRELQFVNDLITSFDVGLGLHQTHIGVLTFGHGVWPQFYLDSHKGLSEITNAVSRITHGRGRTTNTGDALEYTRNIMFSERAGGRRNVSKVAVVVSDGRSQKTLFTQTSAKLLQKEGIVLFAISIGFRQDHKELGAIASDPDDEHKFALDESTELSFIKERISAAACRVSARQSFSTATPVPGDERFLKDQNPVKDCEKKKADIFFLVDASYSITKENFGKEMEFVHDIIDVLDIGPNKTRIGLLTFSDVSEFYIQLSYNMKKEEYQQQLNYVKYIGGGTDTGTAIRRMREEGFSSDLGPSSDRGHVAKIAIVLTDGLSLNPDITAREADLARKMGIQIFAIGIGHGVDKLELRDIANDPDAKFVLHVDDFGSLREIRTELASRSCTVEPSEPLLSDQAVCVPSKPTDLLFIYDSVSLGSWKSQSISQFIVKSIREFDLVSGVLRVGREIENCPTGNIPLGSALQASDLSLVRYSTFPDMLKRVTRSRFTVENGGRENSFKMAVVFIDMERRIDYGVMREIRRLKDGVDFFYIVSVGHNLKLLQLTGMAGNGHYISVRNYEDLNSVADKLMGDICDFFFESSVEEI